MLKKIKKYFLLIPTLIVMLLHCVCYGQVVAVDSDYSEFFVEPPEYLIESCDFTDVDSIDLFDFPDYSSYYYQVYCSKNDLNNYRDGNIDSFSVNFLIVDFGDSDSFVTIEPTTFTTTSVSYHLYTYTYRRGIGFEFYNDVNLPRYFYFQPLTCNWGFNSSAFSPSEWPLDTPNFVTLYVECDYFDLNSSSSSSLDVQVRFSPDLTDSLDRSFTDSEGNTYLRSDLSMRVNNFSNFPIQYTMVITSALVDVDNVFSYYSNDWVYSRSLDSYDDYYSDVAQKQQKSTFAHYVGSGQVDVVNFNFNQINLVQGGIYTVRVYAGRNDCGYASEFVLSSDDLALEPHHINYSIVYESTFSVLQYDDVKYDPSNSSNGILPYNYGLSEKYTHSYNAIEKENGEIDYTAKDVYSDNDSWYNQPPVDNSLSSSASSTSSFLNFTKSFKNFFAFINYMFNFLPKDAKTLFTIGFSGLTIIALVKVLFKS